MSVHLYGLRRPWSEAEASWNAASSGELWAVAGADDPSRDRDEAALASTVVSGGETWYEWDITELVQSWWRGERENYGLMLMGAGDEGIDLAFSSREGAYPPQLIYRYQPPTATPTPTNTATPTPLVTDGPSPTPTPTFAPTPTPIPGSLSVQPQSDAYISQWFPNNNFAGEKELIVRQGDIVASLLQFDLSAIPAGTEIHGAYLMLYAHDRSNTGSLYTNVYKVRRPWTAEAATWQRASQNVAWTQAGCNGEGSDRDQIQQQTLMLNAANYWFTYDITSMVRDWVNNPADNYGLILKGFGNTSVQYHFASTEWPDPAFRPRLVISAGELPTLTPTMTSTPTPVQTWTPTPTSTLTPTITPTPTQTNTPTVGPTPTWTLTPTLTNTPVASPTITPTPTEYVAPTPVPLEDALRLDPVADTTLNSWGPTENLGDSEWLLVRKGDYRASMLQFDVSVIPAGAYVQRAVLQFYVDDRTNMGTMTASVYPVLRQWKEMEATWERAAAGVKWQVAGCNGATDRDLNPAAWMTLDGSDMWFGLDITPLVQSWVNNPDANYGLVIKGSGTASVEYAISSREAENADKRPRLYVQYSPSSPTPTQSPTLQATATWTPTIAGTPTYTPTPTSTPTSMPTAGPTPTSTPTLRLPPTPMPGAVVVPVTRDTFVNNWHIDKNYGLASTVIVRQGGIKSGLWYADLSSISPEEHVLSARLHLFIAKRSNVGYMFASVRKVLREWSADEANWVLAGKGKEWYEPGCTQVGLDRGGETISEVMLTEDGAWVTFDITKLASDWVARPESNFGLLIEGSGSAAVEYEFASCEHPMPELRPWLEVVHSATQPTPVPSLTPSITPTPTMTRTPLPTLTPTITPTPGAGDIIIQTGDDVTLDSWAPDTNQGNAQKMDIRQGNIRSGLLRFDLSAIPAGAAIERATLHLHVVERSNWRDLTLALYRVRRTWDELGATWKLAGSGQPWGVPGCDGIGTDRDEFLLASALFPEPGQTLTVDITELVREWHMHPDENNGLLLKGWAGCLWNIAWLLLSIAMRRCGPSWWCSAARPCPPPRRRWQPRRYLCRGPWRLRRAKIRPSVRGIPISLAAWSQSWPCGKGMLSPRCCALT
jgi:hypothetical protein